MAGLCADHDVEQLQGCSTIARRLGAVFSRCTFLVTEKVRGAAPVSHVGGPGSPTSERRRD
jgi:hypothetical protein